MVTVRQGPIEAKGTNLPVIRGFGVDIQIRTLGNEFEDLLKMRAEKLRSLRIPLNKFGEYLVDELIPLTFKFQGNRKGGEAWAPLSPRYAIQKRRRWGQKPILIASGRMYRGFSFNATRKNMVIRNETDYAKYHQFGTSKMPARKWLQLMKSDYNVLRKNAKDYVLSTAETRYG